MSRIALVIGNQTYKRLGRLATPKNDASAIAKKLRGLDFDVDERIDATKDTFADALARFQERMRGAEASLFFYAGHGFQFEDRNYLAPVDIEGDSAGNLTWHSIEVKKILDTMSKLPQTSLVILDACRESVVFRRWIENASTTAQTRDMRLTFGFTKIEPHKTRSGMHIAFSTEPGGVAIDTLNGTHSPFVDALLSHIDEPGISTIDLMLAVRGEVQRMTGGRQVPWDESSLVAHFYFSQGDAIEKHLFKTVIRKRAGPLEVDGFLTKYPSGTYQSDAIEVLKDQLKSADNIVAIEAYLKNMRNEDCIHLTSRRLAELTWKPLRKSKDIVAVDAFLERFPDFHEARERIADLHLMRLGRNPELKSLSELIDKFGDTEAAKKADEIRRRMREAIVSERLKERARLHASMPISVISSEKLSTLAIVIDLLLVVTAQLSDLVTALLTGIITFLLAIVGWKNRHSVTNAKVFWVFVAVGLTSLILSSALSQFGKFTILGFTSFQSFKWIWAIAVSISGASLFCGRIESTSYLLSTAYGVAVGLAFSLANEPLSAAKGLITVVSTTIAFWLTRAWVTCPRKVHPS